MHDGTVALRLCQAAAGCRPLTFYGFFWCARGTCRAGRNLGKGGDSYNKMKCTHHLVLRLCDVAPPPGGPPTILPVALGGRLSRASCHLPVAAQNADQAECVRCMRQLSGVIGAERSNTYIATKSKSNYRFAALHNHQQVYISFFCFPVFATQSF